MRSLRLMACALLFCPLPGVAQPPPAATATPAREGDLAGLWQARRRFGPDAIGPLLIRRTGDGYRAEMAGRTVPVRVEGNLLTFELPGDRGAFRGRIEGGIEPVPAPCKRQPHPRRV